MLEGLRVGSEGNWTRRAREAGDGEARGVATTPPGAAARGRRLGGGRGHWRTSGRSSAPVSRAGAVGHVRPLRESRELEEGLCAAGLEAPCWRAGSAQQGGGKHGGLCGVLEASWRERGMKTWVRGGWQERGERGPSGRPPSFMGAGRGPVRGRSPERGDACGAPARRAHSAQRRYAEDRRRVPHRAPGAPRGRGRPPGRGQERKGSRRLRARFQAQTPGTRAAAHTRPEPGRARRPRTSCRGSAHSGSLTQTRQQSSSRSKTLHHASWDSRGRNRSVFLDLPPSKRCRQQKPCFNALF